MAPDGRRRNEEIPEKDLLVLNETSGPKSKRITRTSTGGTASSYSDDSLEDPAQAPIMRRSTRGSGTGTGSSEEQSESSKKRKSDESDSTNRKSRKVTFSDGKRAAGAAAKKKKADKKKPAGRAGTSYGTRSTRASGGELMSELPPASKPNKLIKTSSVPKLKKDENVKVIKMLTGTLYLYRGETRRAEFVRSKYWFVLENIENRRRG